MFDSILFYIVYSILHILNFEFALFFFFSSFKTSFFLSKDKSFFSPLLPSMIDFLIKCFDYLITNECDLLFGSLSLSAIQTQAFVFSPFGG